MLQEAVNRLDRYGKDEYWAWSNQTLLNLRNNGHTRPYVTRMIDSISIDLENLNSALSMLIDVVVPQVRSSEEHSSKNLANLSTIATFFSGVTATALQMSYQILDSRLQESVNTFYFASLILSISAAVSSLVALAWGQAT